VVYIFVEEVGIDYYCFYKSLENNLRNFGKIMSFSTIMCQKGTFENNKYIFNHSSTMKIHNFAQQYP